MAKVKTAIVLGGGAARGLAHLGVLKSLEQAGIPIDMVVGTSMGAMVGAMYAAHGRVDEFLPKAVAHLESAEFAESKIHALKRGEEEAIGVFEQVGKYMKKARVYSSTVTRQGYFSPEEVDEFFNKFVDDTDIKDLRLPFYAVAADITTGEQVVIDHGSVKKAVIASSAIPGAFPPVKIGERTCIDGGIVNMAPATVAIEKGADFVIAVNVSHELPKPAAYKRALAIYFRAHEITKNMLIAHQTLFADVLITPNVGKIHWADFTNHKTLIEAGRKSADDKLPAIFAMLRKLQRRPRIFWKRKVKLKDMIPRN